MSRYRIKRIGKIFDRFSLFLRLSWVYQAGSTWCSFLPALESVLTFHSRVLFVGNRESQRIPLGQDKAYYRANQYRSKRKHQSLWATDNRRYWKQRNTNHIFLVQSLPAFVSY